MNAVRVHVQFWLVARNSEINAECPKEVWSVFDPQRKRARARERGVDGEEGGECICVKERESGIYHFTYMNSEASLEKSEKNT